MNNDILLTIHIVSCIEEEQKIPDEKRKPIEAYQLNIKENIDEVLGK
jgi:hypothetical protein